MAKKSSLTAENVVLHTRTLQRERAERHRVKLKESGMKTVSVIIPETNHQIVKDVAETIRMPVPADEAVVVLRVPKRWEEILKSIGAEMRTENYEELEKLAGELVDPKNYHIK